MRYPIGIDDFGKLRRGGYAYVDKTRHIIEMLDAGVALFLSRPRRFGKSLTVSTLAELYGGLSSKPLFEGLWAYDNWDFEAMERPVLWLRFNDIDTSAGLEPALAVELVRIAATLDVDLDPEAKDWLPSRILREIVLALAASHPSGQCVALFDEYDKPIVDYLDDPEQAEANLTAIKRFYGVLKGLGAQLEVLFLTGVSAFSKVSIFSDLNHVANLTLDPLARTVVGMTTSELEEHFGRALDDTGVDRDIIRRWYNGYSWGGPPEQRVYNPWSVLNFARTGQLKNYWFQTGTPTWLVRMMRNQNAYVPVANSVSEIQLTGFRVDDIDLTAALFQTGYLTTVGVEDSYGDYRYFLDYPNVEVQQSLQTMLLASYLEASYSEAANPVATITQALDRDDLGTVFAQLNALLAGVPYDLWQRGDEAIYHAIVHLTFELIGIRVRSEVHTAKGRCDALVETDTHVYAFEFKRDRPVEDALAQIEERGYLVPYAASAKTRVAVGVRFDSDERQIGEWRTG